MCPSPHERRRPTLKHRLLHAVRRRDLRAPLKSPDPIEEDSYLGCRVKGTGVREDSGEREWEDSFKGTGVREDSDSREQVRMKTPHMHACLVALGRDKPCASRGEKDSEAIQSSRIMMPDTAQHHPFPDYPSSFLPGRRA